MDFGIGFLCLVMLVGDWVSLMRRCGIMVGMWFWFGLNCCLRCGLKIFGLLFGVLRGLILCCLLVRLVMFEVWLFLLDVCFRIVCVGCCIWCDV